MPRSNPLIIAHRGDSHNAPENTLAAFRLALAKGADGVEFDVQLARDGVPVVIHDFNLKRTARRAERVAEVSSVDLASLDTGSWFNRKFPDRARAEYASESVPTLIHVLDTVSESSRIYIELKCDKHDDYAKLVRAVVNVLKDFAGLDRVVVKSFKLATLPIVKSLLPEVTTAALFEPTILRLLRKKEYLIGIAREAAADELSLHTSLATKQMTAAAQAANMPVTIWTADNPSWTKRAAERSIRAVITNDPAALLMSRNRE